MVSRPKPAYMEILDMSLDPRFHCTHLSGDELLATFPLRLELGLVFAFEKNRYEVIYYDEHLHQVRALRTLKLS